MPAQFVIRTECPPGSCICGRDALLADPQGDVRILRLTRDEEKKLLARIENISSYADLRHMQQRILAQLGLVLTVAPGVNEVRTVRGIQITVQAHPGMCRKTRQAIPAALRRCFENKPDIVYAVLNAHDLLGGA